MWKMLKNHKIKNIIDKFMPEYHVSLLDEGGKGWLIAMTTSEEVCYGGLLLYVNKMTGESHIYDKEIDEPMDKMKSMPIPEEYAHVRMVERPDENGASFNKIGHIQTCV